MNVLAMALKTIGAVHGNNKVELIRRYCIGEEKGREQFEYKRLNVYAQVQPASQEANAADAYLGGKDIRQFWINGKKAAIADFIKNKEEAATFIIYKGKVWTANSIDDWSNGGWIKIMAALSDEYRPNDFLNGEEEERETENDNADI